MRTINSVKSLRTALKKHRLKDKSIGFVPTMGALHEGHLSLIRKARRNNDIVVLSIFVNPKQFLPKEDFKAYPREEKKDKLLAKKEKVDIIFHPSVEEVYPSGFLTNINVEDISDTLCGKSRPGHFQGVATIVGKLINVVQPHILYLGQKDAQQAAVLKRMVADLNFPVTIRICPTIREPDGLALSSRNKYLTSKQRQEAPILYRSLKEAKQKILNGERKTAKTLNFIRSEVRRKSSGKIDYIACVDADSLTPLKHMRGNMMLCLAVRFGKARLIDNIIFKAK